MSMKKLYLSVPTHMVEDSNSTDKKMYGYERVKRMKTRISSDKIYSTDVPIEIPSDFFEGETSDEY